MSAGHNEGDCGTISNPSVGLALTQTKRYSRHNVSKTGGIQEYAVLNLYGMELGQLFQNL